jgi:hypothetical protein
LGGTRFGMGGLEVEDNDINYYGEVYTVKARQHHSTRNMDLTIPIGFVRKYNILKGDRFNVKATKIGDKTVLSYKRIFSKAEAEAANNPEIEKLYKKIIELYKVEKLY